MVVWCFLVTFVLSLCVCVMFLKRRTSQIVKHPLVYRDHRFVHKLDPLDPVVATIFVSVPSYRDEMCNATIHSAFENATYPHRVVIGACEQNGSIDEMCLTNTVTSGVVKLISIPYQQARGPCLARYMCYTLFQNEDIYLQIDSHTKFKKGWDVDCVNMLNQGPYPLNEAVYSTHPIDTTVENWPMYEPPVITNAKWDGNYFTFQATFRGHGYKTARQIGGGFLLTHGSVVRKVPLDPHLSGLFNGEELLYTARLFTHGIHILAPSKNIVAHMYTYTNHKVPWNDDTFSWNKNEGETDGTKRADELLSGALDDKTYGMGNERTLEQFWDYIGINYKKRIVHEWKPFVFDKLR